MKRKGLTDKHFCKININYLINISVKIEDYSINIPVKMINSSAVIRFYRYTRGYQKVRALML